LARVGLSPDAVEYVAIARAWLEGRGWVDPIVYTYHLTELRPPAPAFAIRAPLASLLFAAPLALGAALPGLAVAHAAWASLVGGAGVLMARRAMSLPAATAFGVAMSWSFGWVTYARRLLTEITAGAALLLVLGLVRGVARSHRRALLLGAALWLAWLARPNLAVLLPAVLAAAALETGLRAAPRTGPLWTLAASFVALQQLTSYLYGQATGFAPYSNYSLAFASLDAQQQSAYGAASVTLLEYLRTHSAEVAGVLTTNLRKLFRSMFVTSAYLRIGWLALPALAWVLARRGPSSLERRAAAFAALLLLAVAWLAFGAFDPVRSPFLVAICFAFVSCAALDDLASALTRRLGTQAHAAAAARALPILLVIALWLPENAPGWLRATRAHWNSHRRHGTELRMVSAHGHERPVRKLCARLEPDALVASVDPWAFLLWCGNAGLALPSNLDTVAGVDGYLADRAPAYVVVDRRPDFYSFIASARLRRVESAGPLTLYAVKDPAPESRPWRAPTPLASTRDLPR
jgi:hypothetical protein